MDFQISKRKYNGQLQKYTNVMKGFQHRFFILNPKTGYLYYYLSENGEKVIGSRPRGTIHLANAEICPSDEDSRTFTVNCANGTCIRLKAIDALERQEWVDSLRAVAESHSHAGMHAHLAPSDYLAVMDAFGGVRSTLYNTEKAHVDLCKVIEANKHYFNDRDVLLLKSVSASALQCLTQCLSVLQQIQQSRMPYPKMRKMKSKESV